MPEQPAPSIQKDSTAVQLAPTLSRLNRLVQEGGGDERVSPSLRNMTWKYKGTEFRVTPDEDSPATSSENGIPTDHDKRIKAYSVLLDKEKEADGSRWHNKIIQLVFGTGDRNILRNNSWESVDNVSIPREELAVLEILLNRNGFDGIQHSYPLNSISEIITDTMLVLRKSERDPGRAVLWGSKGIEGEGYKQGHPKELAKEIVKKLSTTKNLTISQFDACISTILSCGDVRTALEVIVQSGDLSINDMDKKGMVEKLLKRLCKMEESGEQIGSLFQEARKLYPPNLQKEMDVAFASIGETIGALQILPELNKLPFGLQLKEEAQKRLFLENQKKAQKWYVENQVASEGKRKDGLSESGLKALLESASTAPNGSEMIEKGVAESAKQTTQAEVANVLAHELSRRLFPELNPQDMVRRSQRELYKNDEESVMREVGFMENQMGDSTLKPLRGLGLLRDPELTSVQKQIEIQEAYKKGFTVERFTSIQQFEVARDLYRIMRDPDAYLNRVGEEIKRNLDDLLVKGRSSKENSAHYVTAMQNGKQNTLTKVLSGIQFMSMCVGDPALKDIFIAEFGMTKAMLEGDRLPNIINKLTAALATTILDKQDDNYGLAMDASGKPFKTVKDADFNKAQETYKLSAEQRQEDEKKRDELSSYLEKKPKDYVEDAEKTLPVLAKTLLETSQIALASLQISATGVENRRSAYEEAKRQLTILIGEKANLERKPIKSGLKNMFNRDAITQEELSRQLGVLEQQIKQHDSIKSQYELDVILKKIESIDADELATLEKRVGFLKTYTTQSKE